MPSLAAARSRLLPVLALMSLLPRSAPGQPTMTQEEALRIAFPPPAVIERRTAYLDEAELDRTAELAGPGVRVESSVVTHYVGSVDGQVVGVAYFDAHRVRTLPEVLMVVVTPGGTVQRIEVLKFSEPPEYRPPDGWLEQFSGEALSGDVSLKGGIVTMTGATLTSEAATGAVRRVLAMHEVIQPLAVSR